jgi:hypothetical protein
LASKTADDSGLGVDLHLLLATHGVTISSVPDLKELRGSVDHRRWST